MKEENSLGWGDPGGLARLEERADTFGAAGCDVQMPQARAKGEKCVRGSWSKGKILCRPLANYL